MGEALVDRPTNIERKELFEAFSHKRGRALAIVTDLQTAHLYVFQEQIVHCNGRDAASRESDNDKATTPCKRSNGGVEDVSTERVDDDIYTFVVRQRIYALAQPVAQVRH